MSGFAGDTVLDGTVTIYLRRDRSWLFQASRKHRVLATLDPGYVRATADEHCSGLMQQYFPEVSSPN